MLRHLPTAALETPALKCFAGLSGSYGPLLSVKALADPWLSIGSPRASGLRLPRPSPDAASEAPQCKIVCFFLRFRLDFRREGSVGAGMPGSGPGSGQYKGQHVAGPERQEPIMAKQSKKTTKTIAHTSAADITTETQPAGRVTRREALHQALATEQGASIQELCATFGWQPHSARAALSGLRKSGTAVDRILPATAGGEARYRVAVKLGQEARQ